MNSAPDVPRSRRRLYFWLFIAAFPVVGILLFYLIENWRGERAWEEEKARLQSAGIPLDFAAHLPVPLTIPDAENVAAASYYKEACLPGWNDKDPFECSWFTDIDNRIGNPATGTPPRQPYQNVDTSRADLAAMRAAAARRHVRFPVDWEKDVLVLQPHFELCSSFANFLSLRSSALIAAGRSGEALVDWKLLLRQAEIVHAPTFFALRHENFILAASIPHIWLGLSQGAWDDAQLAEIDATYALLQPLNNCIGTIKADLTLFVSVMDQCVKDRSAGPQAFEFGFSNLFGVAGWASQIERAAFRTLARVIPAGWLRQNQASHGVASQALIRQVDGFLKSPASLKPSSFPHHGRMSLPKRMPVYDFLSAVVINIGEESFDESLQTAAHIAMARTAIRLEQHRRSHGGSLPASLADLSPPPPVDPITGGPLHYVRLDATRFQLWSVALDGADNGGTMGIFPVHYPSLSRLALDWPWQSYVVPPKP